jgi:fructose-1,6-bisphosphatase/inositol monophosphatase family enzyme
MAMTGDEQLIDELLALATAIALEAGTLLAARVDGGRESVGTKTSVTDMVTEVDRESEALIVARVRAARPDDAIVGEEGAARDGTTGVRWVVDPLDGTTNYLYGYPAYAVSIGVEVDGDTEVGVVYDAARGQTFAAARGRGATLDRQTIAVSTKADLATALIGTGFAYDAEVRREQGPALAYLLPRIRDIRRSGSAALDLCSVACGRLDGYFERGLNEWDLCAGALIVREAGGLTMGFDGRPAKAGTIIAAGPGLMDPLRELLREAGAFFD